MTFNAKLPTTNAAVSRPNEPHPLDHVVWNALTSRHRDFAQGDVLALRYPANVCPFGATSDISPASFRSLASLLTGNTVVALVTPKNLWSRHIWPS